jgi:nucleoside phosphorylase
MKPTNSSPPIDVAVITALKIEREAMCQHLENLEVVQDENQPLTYYRGSLPLSGVADRYEVVVVQLESMGNVRAGVTTTELLSRWEPHTVIMVGIAGGIRGRVRLGDVVVADAVYYYELAKIVADGQQSRPQEFPTDRLLFNRAQANDGTDWPDLIQAARPEGTYLRPHEVPEVHFGYIAAGEKVVADSIELNRLVQAQPQLRAVAMEGAGVALAARQHAPEPRFLEVRGICDYADTAKNDDWQSYAAHAAAGFMVGLLLTRPVVAPEPTAARQAELPLVILRAESLRPIAPEEIRPALGDAALRMLEPVGLDFTDFVAADRVTDPLAAARRLADPYGPLSAALARRAHVELAFHGLVHIPLAMLAGYLVTDRQPVRLFDYHPSLPVPTWQWPDTLDTQIPLVCRSSPAAPAPGTNVAVIRVSVSYAVTAVQTAAVIAFPRTEVDLSVPDPQRGIVTSEAQVRRCGAEFRRELDRLTRFAPELERVHLFYSGPVALAFHIGQQISANIHPPVTVWNFRRGIYEWGLDLAAAATQAESSITTAAGPGSPVPVTLQGEEPA